jgi:membrane protease YdiL (CAAX protease family)
VSFSAQGRIVASESNEKSEVAVKSNGKLQIVLAIATGLIIFVASVILPKYIVSDTIPRLLTTQATELVLAFLAILLLGKGKFAQYGFRLQMDRLTPSGGIVPWILLGLAALTVGALASITMMATGATGNPIIKQLSFPQVILFVFLFSSTIEEIFTRGFIQSHLAASLDSSVRVPLLRVDRPTFISALFFAGMHLVLVTHQTDVKTIVIILLFTFSLGLIAGHVRARTGSLIPAIGAHMLGNIGGMVGGILYVLFTVVTGGKLPTM